MEIIIEKSLVPIYEQIYIQIKQQIIKGDILSESELPSIRGLAKSIGVSVITVKKAYELLLQDDLVTSVPVSKRSYVLSRYMTGGILIIIGIIPTLLIFLLKYIFGQRVVPSFVIEGISLAVLLSLIVLAIAIPLFYKYSPEVARTYFLIGIFIVGFGLPFLFSQLNLSIHLSLVNLFIFLIVITIVALLLSIHLSIKIFSKKILLN